MSAEPFQYKLFDLYTQSYILTNSQDPNSVLIEEVPNSLLEKILPPEAKQQLSIATISEGMDAETIDNNHPDPENNVLLLAKGSRGIYGPPQYKELLAPYLDLVSDYPYQRYLTNENISLRTKDVKIWVVDDEQGISGIEDVGEDTAKAILGDSHGKMSLSLAEEMGSPETLMQYRMIGADPQQGWFAKGTFAPSLKNTLAKFKLENNPELQDVDLIVPTSSLKGFSKVNLPPGVHQQQVHLTNHDVSHSVDFSMRAVVEKLDGDALAGLLREQSAEIDKLNRVFASSDTLNEEFLKSLEPVFMRDPNNPEAKERFDPERWQECGDWKYITFRKDLEGHQQLVNSPIFAADKQKWYASRARKASQLSFVKAKGGTIFCSSELTNNQIYVPQLPDGAKMAAVRSPIINLADIALVENKVIEDIYNDAGQPIEGAIVCSPQQFDALFNQTKLFVQSQTAALVEAGVDVSGLNALNPWSAAENRQVILAGLADSDREELVRQLNQWREAYNNLAIASDLPELTQIRQDTFASIIKCDYDGDKIAFVSQAEYPAVYAGIAARIAEQDAYTTKLDKIKVEGERSLSELVADKVDPYSLGKTANLAENLQSFAVASKRVENLGTPEQQESYLREIAPSFYYLIANPSSAEIKEAEAKKLLSTFRYYEIGSTGEKLIDPALVERFDAYGLDKALLQLQQGQSVTPIVRQRLFSVWQELLLDINQAVAQQNQIAVDTFKSERPIDKDLIENVGRRLKILDDGLKKSLKDNQTFLTKTPEIKNSLTNRSLFVENVVQNLLPYDAPVNSYQQIQGLFPEVEDERIQQEVAAISNEYDKLTSLAGTIRAKARIDSGPSLFFNDAEGRSFEITNILNREESFESFKAELVEGEIDIRIEPNTETNSPHKLFALYRRGGEWQNLGTVCDACTQSLDLNPDRTINLSEVTGIKFANNSAIHLADSYAQSAYKKAAEFRNSIPPEQVETYAAATYNYLTKTTSKGNRLGLMFQMFGKELATQIESMELDNLKLDFLSGVSVPDEPIEIEIETDVETGKQNVMWLEGDRRERLGSISEGSFQLRSGTNAKASASYIPPSVADITLPTGEKFTVGGMNKSMFGTAGEILADENLEMEIAPGKAFSHPAILVDGQIVGRLKESSVKYLEDNQLLNQGQELDLTLTTIGKGRYQKLKAVTANGKVLEVYGLKPNFQASMSEHRVKATIGFESQKGYDCLYLYRQGKKVAVGEFNYGSAGSHRRSLTRLKELGLYKQPFQAKIDSRVSVLNLKLDPDSIVYNSSAVAEQTEPARSSTAEEKNPDTSYFLQRQQQYQSYGLLRQRDYLNDTGEIESVLSLDLVIDRQAQLPELQVLKDFQELEGGDSSIAIETTKGFRVLSAPLANLDAAKIDSLKQELKLKQIIDLSSDPVAQTAYQNQLRSDYRDLVDFEAIPDGSERLFLPRLEAISTSYIPTVSLPLLEAIQSQAIDTKQQKPIDLDRFDLLWLQSALGLAEDLSKQEIIAQSFTDDNLAKIEYLVSGQITPEGELVYQHLQAGTDARFATELESALGIECYQYHLNNAKRLIEKEIVPVVIESDGSARTPEKLLVERVGQMPLPETIDKNLATAIEISGEDEFGRVLNNPADYLHPDLKHPINYDGQTYASIQHAFSEIVNAESIPQNKTYGLIKSLTISKFQQYPQIVDEIKQRGGYKWLYSCTHKLEGNDFWSGKGKDSPMIGVLSSALKQAGAAAKTQEESNNKKNKKIITLKSGAKRQIQTAKTSQTGSADLGIKGKPISMNFELKLGDRPNPLPVDNCFDAMRGHGRSHTTRNFQPYKAYGIKEGDLAIAFKGPRDNPTGQVVIKVGKQYRLDRDTINNPEFQQKWAEREKHAPETLPNLFNKEIEAGKEVWGMTFEPVGDLIDGQIVDFAKEQKTQHTASIPKPVSKQNQPANRQEPSTANVKLPVNSPMPTDKPELNLDQLAAKTGLLEFLNGDSSSQFATLAGAAGTGKTYLVQQILAEYKAQNPKAVVAFTAPTHAAVRVLENMSARAGVQPDFEGTIYKLLQVKPSIDERTGEQTFIKENQKYAGEKIKPDLIVLDEGSMVGKNLYHFLQEAIAANTKVLVMGDPAQLPPVNEVISPVFSDPAIESKFELKQIMRYDGDLIATNDTLRESIEKIMAAEKFDDLKLYLNGFKLDSSKDGQISAMKGNDWESSAIAMFTSPEFQQDSNYVKAVAYRNVRVNELNQKIRTALHGDNIPQFVSGDLIITTAPSPILDSTDMLLNSTSLKVKEAILMREANTEYDVWQLECEISPTQTESIAVVADSSLDRYKHDLQQKWQQALKEPKGSTARKQAFRHFYEHKQLFASVDHNYAITAHRAQGSTYQHVAVDHNDLRVRLNHAVGAKDFNAAKQALKEYHQLLYVAGTRAKSAVLVADDEIKLDLQPIAQEKPVPAPPMQKNNIVAMINLPNVDKAVGDYQVAKANLTGDEQANLKENVTKALNRVKSQSQLLDSIKTWNSKTGEQVNTNSLIANFKDSPSNETLKYHAALIGRETGQKAVISFREDINGDDALLSFNVSNQNHRDEYAIQAKLESVGIQNYSLIPTPNFIKVVISDRHGSNLSIAEELAKQYDTILRITQGKSTVIPEREFDRIIESFEKENRRNGREGNGDRSDSTRRQSQPSVRPRNRAAIAPRPKASQPAVSPATRQSELIVEAIPILQELLNLTPGKRNFTNGEIVVKYDSETRKLLLVDLESSQIKLQATHNGTSWQSDTDRVRGLDEQDIPLLKAALVIAKQEHETQSQGKSAFASLVNEPVSTDKKEHQVSAVER